MANKIGQIGKYNGPASKRLVKRATSKARRRNEARLLEDAPTRLRDLTKGYAD